MTWFTKESLEFLQEIKQHNSREWYAQHKSDYQEYVLAPLQSMVGELSEVIVEIDPVLDTTPAVDRTISRIFRDTRFSRDKSRYKDKMWIMFRNRDKEKLDYPSFYFEYSPYSYRYGMGFYQASAKTMEGLRDKIDQDERKFLNIIAPILNNPRLEPQGDLYKRSRYTGSNPEVARWYDRRNIYIMCSSTHPEALFTVDIATQIKSDFRDMEALYRYFREIVFSAS